MMQNELYDGYGAYKVSYANAGKQNNKSGLSFGANQIDMNQRDDAVELFKNILENAKDNKRNLIVPINTLKIINGSNDSNLKKTHQTPEQVFGKKSSACQCSTQ